MTDVLGNADTQRRYGLSPLPMPTADGFSEANPADQRSSIIPTPGLETDSTNPVRDFFRKLVEPFMAKDDGYTRIKLEPDDIRARKVQAENEARRQSDINRIARDQEKALRQRDKQMLGAPIVKAWVNMRNATREFVEVHTSRRTARLVAGVGGLAVAGVGLYTAFKFASDLADSHSSLTAHAAPKGTLPIEPKIPTGLANHNFPVEPKLPTALIDHAPKPTGIGPGASEQIQPRLPKPDIIEPISPTKPVQPPAELTPTLPTKSINPDAMPYNNLDTLGVNDKHEAMKKIVKAYSKKYGVNATLTTDGNDAVLINGRYIFPGEELHRLNRLAEELAKEELIA